MVKDPGNNGGRRRMRVRSGSSRGGGIGGNLISALLPMLLRRPKLLLIAVVAGVIFYFLGGKSCMSGAASQVINQFTTGGLFNKEVYEQTEIYEPLADNIKNPLPEKVSLLKYAPKRLNQGRQGSCVAWASAYAARTILEAQRTGKNPNQLAFSPAFTYNQISIDKNTCQGSYIKLAMDNMLNVGTVPFNDFPYDDRTCTKEPGSSLKEKAKYFKIKGFQRLTEEDTRFASKEMLAIKQNLAQGSPVIIGMMVGGTFMSNMKGKEVWIPTQSDYSQRGFGGHAMCIIGYDDYKEGGAFQIMNSWGEDWGKDGIAWIRYTDFKAFNIESYGLYPMGNAYKKKQTEFKGSFGLELNEGKKTIDLSYKGGIYFETIGKLSPGDRFKVEFTNNIECYTYIFGEETDGSSYVLFPYTKKHSPYCGIVGTRLFPRDYSMTPDEKGNTDKIAIVITKHPLDYPKLNELISKSSGNNYEEKVKNVLGQQLDKNTLFSNRSNIVQFKSSTEKDKFVAFVIGVKK